jgi:hypothetical protein
MFVPLCWLYHNPFETICTLNFIQTFHVWLQVWSFKDLAFTHFGIHLILPRIHSSTLNLLQNIFFVIFLITFLFFFILWGQFTIHNLSCTYSLPIVV